MDNGRMKEKLLLQNGDALYYLGEKRLLTVICENRKRSRAKMVLDRLLLFVPYEAGYEEKREQLEKWYRKEASVVLSEKAAFYAERLSVTYREIHIKDQKSRWGSCSSLGNLNFNWRILMAPESVCDYIVIHELCHLKHMDHSERFWRLVERNCPEYRQYRKWLKEHGGELYPF